MATLKLRDTVRLVALQFMLSKKFVRANPDVLLDVRPVDPEVADERAVRKERNASNEKGALLIVPTKRVTLSVLVNDLTANFELIDAKQQIRRNDRGDWDCIVRYLFVKREFFLKSQDFAKFTAKRDNILAGFRTLCERFMWRGQIFQNPLFQNGNAAEGCVTLDVNLKEREELFQPNGQPVMVWQRDENGKRVGDAPLPLKANCYLRLKDDTVVLVAV